MMQLSFWLLAGAALGALAAWAWMRPRLIAHGAQVATLRAQLAEAGAAQVRLAEVQAQLAKLRHDVRGILSPAMLVSDRLLTHEEAQVRRAGEVVVHAVERASARLAETRLDQEAPASG